MSKSIASATIQRITPAPNCSSSLAQNPLIFSFFSGAGFLDLGFEKAGFQIAYVNEVHKPFLDAYKYSRRKMGTPPPLYGYFEGDIECCIFGEEAKRLGSFVSTAKGNKQCVGFIGGPPCPDFSVGGKNRGQYGENGKLSKIYVDLICKQKPDFFVFENVKGLYRTFRHRQFFDALKRQLAEVGYSCTERLINAIEYGAPQDRERIILFGVKQPQTKKNLPRFDWYAHVLHREGEALRYSWPSTQAISRTRPRPTNIPVELTVQHWFERNNVEHHPNAQHQFKPRACYELGLRSLKS